ncbi:hypothetical protein FK178_07335 [Antarcticibacterium arcticum]|uniref:Uncharacterized protein n=1 Tax=Antarcticibacterium arcticum TaxID=2585771 RepID=A0A5B8YNY7_9FLAO|nr:hypothetical protein [Antarcticibacterium arcticum]QED37549.1 hypothetical protein FK178_07335 [Antarcticibacterium arcticum]
MLFIGVTACSVEDAVHNENNIQEVNLLSYDGEVDCGETVIWPFGTMDHGWVEAKVVGDNLSVQIFAGDGKSYNQSRVEVATEPEYFPLKGGGLPPGQIQERDHFDNDPYLFPLSLFGDDCEIFIAAWAIITPGGSEADHWAGNLEFVEGNPNRGLYFAYCFECEQDEPGDVCESAYAYSPNPTETLVARYGGRPSNQNWGWFNYVDIAGPGQYETLDIYAAAGQNDISKGTWVGTVRVYYDGSTTFYPADDFSFSNIHVYIGETMPTTRLAPGHFESSSTAVSGGDFYVIIHLEACADEEDWD